MDLISVIVPIYNVEQYLDRCVESIVHQTYPELEIILVDDGSPDSCPMICDQWAKKDKRIKVIHKQNGGLSDARNAGIKVATGSYISFVDSDDWIALNFYEVLHRALYETNSDIAACKTQKVWKTEDAGEVTADTVHYQELDTETALYELICEKKLQQIVWNKLYRREVVDGIEFEIGKCNEDEFWSYQVFGCAQKSVLIEYIGYYYFQRADSIMGNSYSMRRLDAVEAKCNRQDYLEKHFPKLANTGRENLFFFCIYHGQLTLKYLNGKTRKEAMCRLKKSIKQHMLHVKDIRGLSFSKSIWYFMVNISFYWTCALRNLLNIGF